MHDKPHLINGGIHIDARGEIYHVNKFNFSDVKRFYIVSNKSTAIIRACQGHKVEQKYFFVVKGTYLICAVKIDNWQNPSRDLKPTKFIMDEKNPAILCIPPGYANGIKVLEKHSKLIIYSNLNLEESSKDIYRFESTLWYNWHESIPSDI